MYLSTETYLRERAADALKMYIFKLVYDFFPNACYF